MANNAGKSTGPFAWPDTSHWSTFVSGAGRDTSGWLEARDQFCATFRGPVYCYLRRDGCDHDEAQDLTQEFFLYVLGDAQPLAEYDQTRGRFRPYFKAVLRHFRLNRLRHDAAAKRGGGHVLQSLGHATGHAQAVAAPDAQAEVEFTRAWAASLLNRVVTRLREESAQSQRKIPLDLLMDRLIDGRTESYPEMAANLGMTAGALRVAAHRLRERFEALLREEIARTVSTPEEIDEEIRDMFSAFSLAGRR